jgi:hypothetical protein
MYLWSVPGSCVLPGHEPNSLVPMAGSSTGMCYGLALCSYCTNSSLGSENLVFQTLMQTKYQ